MGSAEVAETYGYTPMPIDNDRGVSIRQTKDGRRTYMYKSMPGMYLRADGSFASDEVAEAAGFDVLADRRRADVDRRVNEATRNLRLQAAEMEAQIRAGIEPDVLAKMPSFSNPTPAAAPAAPIDIITERNKDGHPRGTRSFLMVHVGGPQWNVVDRDTTAIVFDRVTADVAAQKMVEAQEALDEQA